MDTTLEELFFSLVAWSYETFIFTQLAFTNLWYSPLQLSISQILIILGSSFLPILVFASIPERYQRIGSFGIGVYNFIFVSAILFTFARWAIMFFDWINLQ